MFARLLGIALVLASAAGCGRAATGVVSSPAPAGPSALTAASDGRPWKAKVNWTVTRVEWAGVPGQDKSLFDGRCSVPSDYVISAAYEGEATHAGQVTGVTAHCTQITWSPQGQPIGVAYGDGLGTVVSANGSRMALRYGNGVTGFDSTTGETWFEDQFTLTGESGTFSGATGAGREGGRFSDLPAVLGGAPVVMWMEGTITYSPGRN